MNASVFWAASLHAAAGLIVFIYALNRLLSRLNSGADKLVFLLALLAGLVLIPAGFGALAATRLSHLPWLSWLFPGVILAVFLLGELRLAAHRRRHRGAPPVRQTPPPALGMERLRRANTTLALSVLEFELVWQHPDLTVAHLSDLHLNDAIPADFYARAVSQAQQANPDLILLSGDFVTHRQDIGKIAPTLAGLKTTARLKLPGLAPGKAILASLGNHDYWSDPHAVLQALASLNIPVLEGNCLQAELEGQPVRICADASPWGKALDSAAFSEDSAQPTLVLSHTPDNIYRLLRLPDCAAVFSGHVHAGQFRLPLPWGSASIVIPSTYGRRLDHGHFEFPAKDGRRGRVHLFVSAGVGAAEPPLRLYCPPEVLIVRFRRQT